MDFEVFEKVYQAVWEFIYSVMEVFGYVFDGEKIVKIEK